MNRLRHKCGPLLLASGLLWAADLTAAPAVLDVQGYGWLRDRELEREVALLLGEGEGVARETFDASYLEDAALVLGAELVEEGFFDAKLRVAWVDAEGQNREALLDPTLSRPLPRPLRARRATITAVPGKRAVVVAVEFAGLTVVPAEQAERLFVPDAGLFTPTRLRAWSEARVRRAAERLREVLRARGHAEATVEVVETKLDPVTGEVLLGVRVEEGPLWRVVDWRVEGRVGGGERGDAPAELDGAPWTRALARGLGQMTLREYQEIGYADARVEWSAEPGEVVGGERRVTAVGKVEPGEKWRLGAVRFAGAGKTRADLLESRARLEAGAPLDPAEVDAARLRLARLGVFRRVEARTEPGAEPGVRDVVFELTEAAAWEAAWLIGYGSYEQLRAGVEFGRSNLWGRAHRDRVEVVQSLKSSRGEYRYTVPTLFGDRVEVSGRLYGLRREEPSFVRLEYGAGVEVARELARLRARGSAGLSYEVLRAGDREPDASLLGLTDTTVSAFTLGLTRDERDNPIRPRRGWRAAVRSETALPELGSESRYERLELAWAWHRPLGTTDDRWLHVGGSHGLLASGGQEAPVNKLFFPGGESSLRGFPEGEATQRDAAGRFVGVRSVWMLNIELEQTVTGPWSLVLFSDTQGTAVEIEEWPGDEVLGTVGLGLRYQSPIGPVRLEYGRNLNPRPLDPSGTLHFSIGFPF